MTVTLGVTGPIRAGKTTAARLLHPRGYTRVSLSDWLRKEASERGLPHDRETLMDLGDEERRQFGDHILAQRTAELATQMRTNGAAEKIIIDGLKNPAEIIWLRDNFEMRTIGVTANDDVRLKRALEDSEGPDVSSDIEIIKRDMQRDLGVGQDRHGQNIRACLALADVKVENNGDENEFEMRLIAALEKMGVEGNHKPVERGR